MTNEQMLTELIELAVKNGCEVAQVYWDDLQDEFGGYDLEWTLANGPGKQIWFLFEPDFAKAIFGEEETNQALFEHYTWPSGVTSSEEITRVSWQFHLMQLAIADPKDRIEYAYKHRAIGAINVSKTK